MMDVGGTLGCVCILPFFGVFDGWRTTDVLTDVASLWEDFFPAGVESAALGSGLALVSKSESSMILTIYTNGMNMYQERLNRGHT